jgi:hypothetical protein
VHFAEKYLKLGHWCKTMLKLRSNITESKIFHSYDKNGNALNKVFISDGAL